MTTHRGLKQELGYQRWCQENQAAAHCKFSLFIEILPAENHSIEKTYSNLTRNKHKLWTLFVQTDFCPEDQQLLMVSGWCYWLLLDVITLHCRLERRWGSNGHKYFCNRCCIVLRIYFLPNRIIDLVFHKYV